MVIRLWWRGKLEFRIYYKNISDIYFLGTDILLTKIDRPLVKQTLQKKLSIRESTEIMTLHPRLVV